MRLVVFYLWGLGEGGAFIKLLRGVFEYEYMNVICIYIFFINECYIEIRNI